MSVELITCCLVYLWTPIASPTTVVAAASALAHIGSLSLRHG